MIKKLMKHVFTYFLALLLVVPIAQPRAWRVPAASRTACLSPQLRTRLTGLSEQEFKRLKAKFERSRDPEDLKAIFETLNPVLQRAFFYGFMMELALTEQRPGKSERLFLSPYVPTKNKPVPKNLLIEIKNNDKEQAEKEFRLKYGHSNFFEIKQKAQPYGPYQVGTTIQTVYPFCCGTASVVVSNILQDIEGLLIYQLQLDFSSRHAQTELGLDMDTHFATLVMDTQTYACYYISLTDGQFVVPKNPDGSVMQASSYGYMATDRRDGFLGSDNLYPYSHKKYLDWYISNGLDKVYFKQIPLPATAPEQPAAFILTALHRAGIIPSQLSRLSTREILGTVDLGDRSRMLEFMPRWLAETINKTKALNSDILQKSA